MTPKPEHPTIALARQNAQRVFSIRHATKKYGEQFGITAIQWTGTFNKMSAEDLRRYYESVIAGEKMISLSKLGIWNSLSEAEKSSYLKEAFA